MIPLSVAEIAEITSARPDSGPVRGPLVTNTVVTDPVVTNTVVTGPVVIDSRQAGPGNAFLPPSGRLQPGQASCA